MPTFSLLSPNNKSPDKESDRYGQQPDEDNVNIFEGVESIMQYEK
jgi:hypothetical protein